MIGEFKSIKSRGLFVALALCVVAGLALAVVYGTRINQFHPVVAAVVFVLITFFVLSAAKK